MGFHDKGPSHILRQTAFHWPRLQETEKRGWHMTWAKITGYMCGAFATASTEPTTFNLRSKLLWNFLGLARKDLHTCPRSKVQFLRGPSIGDPDEWPIISFVFGIVSIFSIGWQGFKLMDPELMRNLSTSQWHPESRPELSTWMEHTPSEWSSERLKAIGNVVFPDMAAVALNAIGHELTNSP